MWIERRGSRLLFLGTIYWKNINIFLDGRYMLSGTHSSGKWVIRGDSSRGEGFKEGEQPIWSYSIYPEGTGLENSHDDFVQKVLSSKSKRFNYLEPFHAELESLSSTFKSKDLANGSKYFGQLDEVKLLKSSYKGHMGLVNGLKMTEAWL